MSELRNINWFESNVMGGFPVFTNEQRSAAAYLEERDLRFLIDYGFANCETIAKSMGWIR